MENDKNSGKIFVNIYNGNGNKTVKSLKRTFGKKLINAKNVEYLKKKVYVLIIARRVLYY